jgi:hypothetical protein
MSQREAPARGESPEPTVTLSRCALLSSDDGNRLRIADQVVVVHETCVIVLCEEAPQRIDVSLWSDEQALALQPCGQAAVFFQERRCA